MHWGSQASGMEHYINKEQNTISIKSLVTKPLLYKAYEFSVATQKNKSDHKKERMLITKSKRVTKTFTYVIPMTV